MISQCKYSYVPRQNVSFVYQVRSHFGRFQEFRVEGATSASMFEVSHI